MNSAAWKGIIAGLALFLVGAAVSYLTPLRIPVLKFAGQEYASLRLQQFLVLQAEANPSSAPSHQPSATLKSSPALPTAEQLALRFESWQRRNDGLSVFGFLGWMIDLWPFLIGLGVALPALGGLIGAQIGLVSTAGAASPVPSSSHSSHSSQFPASGSASGTEMETLSAADRPRPTSGESPSSADPESETIGATEPVIPPAAWNWNAPRPAPRAPSRPKPPPVRSPNGESL